MWLFFLELVLVAYIRLVTQGNILAQFNLAQMYRNGECQCPEMA
jgi:hypothetical protein